MCFYYGMEGNVGYNDGSFSNFGGNFKSAVYDRAINYPLNGDNNPNYISLFNSLDKKSFIDYLDSVEDAVEKKKDRDIGDRPASKDLGKKAADKDIVPSSVELEEDPTQEPAPADTPAAQIQEPTYAAQPAAPVKTITLEDGRICEIHGNEHSGFEIRHGNRKLPSRFKNLDHASMALEMWQANCRRQDESADYIDEA